MNKKLSDAALKIIKKMQQNELNESIIYKKIAKFAKGEDNKNTLLRLANEEKAHYEIWKSYTGTELKPQKRKIMKYTLLARLLGFTFAVKLMERGEEMAQGQYEIITSEVPESVHIREQEEEHETALLGILDEERLHYVGSMVLGLSDALVELAGSLAGFTFALQDTKLVALSGTFSMASSEFLSAKSEGRSDAFKSCTYTGIAYLLTVVALILPYILLSNAIVALAAMLLIIILIIEGFTYYTPVAMDLKFGTRFLEMAGISLAVSVISFGVGILAKQLFGIDV